MPDILLFDAPCRHIRRYIMFVQVAKTIRIVIKVRQCKTCLQLTINLLLYGMRELHATVAVLHLTQVLLVLQRIER